MKKLGTLLVLSSLGLFALGCGAVEDAARDVGDAIEDTGRDIEHGADDAAHEAEHAGEEVRDDL